MTPVTIVRVAFVSDSVLPRLRAPDQDWYVHSVFRQAVNLAAGDRLVALVPEAVGGLPNGISVMGRPDFRELLLRQGMVVTGGWPLLVVPEAGLGIDFSRAWTWSPRLRAGSVDPRDSGVHRRTDLAADVVAARATRVGFGQCVRLVRGETDPDDGAEPAGDTVARAVRSIETLREALTADDVPAALDAEDGLLGLGEGLTPSGDDFLVGLTAALRATRHRRTRALARHAAARAGDATTDVARVALEHAARGEYAERLHEVLEAVGRGDDAAVRAQVKRALAWGASSGADTMLGVVIGLEAAAAAGVATA